MKYPNFIPPSKLGVVIETNELETTSVALLRNRDLVINIQSGTIFATDKFATPTWPKLYKDDLISYLDGRPNLENLKPWIHEVKDALEN